MKCCLKSDIVILKDLYSHAQQDLSGRGLHGNSPVGREYKKTAKKLTEKIPQKRGFYLWGKYSDHGLWNNIYLGKAGYGKIANLHNRILEEMGDERCCIWASVLSAIQISDVLKEKHGDMWNKKYYANFRRSMRKCGSSHIVWVATPDLTNKEVGDVEADLIETLNPSANIMRPAPPDDSDHVQEHSNTIIGCMKKLIHANRAERFPTDHV